MSNTTKKKKTCKHKWAIVLYTPKMWIYSGNTTGEISGNVVNDAIAVCTKCLEKRYL